MDDKDREKYLDRVWMIEDRYDYGNWLRGTAEVPMNHCESAFATKSSSTRTMAQGSNCETEADCRVTTINWFERENTSL